MVMIFLIVIVHHQIKRIGYFKIIIVIVIKISKYLSVHSFFQHHN